MASSDLIKAIKIKEYFTNRKYSASNCTINLCNGKEVVGFGNFGVVVKTDSCRPFPMVLKIQERNREEEILQKLAVLPVNHRVHLVIVVFNGKCKKSDFGTSLDKFISMKSGTDFYQYLVNKSIRNELDDFLGRGRRKLDDKELNVLLMEELSPFAKENKDIFSFQVALALYLIRLHFPTFVHNDLPGNIMLRPSTTYGYTQYDIPGLGEFFVKNIGFQAVITDFGEADFGKEVIYDVQTDLQFLYNLAGFTGKPPKNLASFLNLYKNFKIPKQPVTLHF